MIQQGGQKVSRYRIFHKSH